MPLSDKLKKLGITPVMIAAHATFSQEPPLPAHVSKAQIIAYEQGLRCDGKPRLRPKQVKKGSCWERVKSNQQSTQSLNEQTT